MTYEKGVFQLSSVTAKLTHISLNEQKHGKQSVTGLTLKISVTLNNRSLDMFLPGMVSAIYKAEDSPNGDIFEPGAEVALTELIHGSALKSLPINRKLVGACVTVAYGIDDDGAVEFDDAKVDSIVAQPQEGGSIIYDFKVKSLPADGDMDKLTKLLGHEITLTVVPPTDAQGSLLGMDDDDDPDDE